MARFTVIDVTAILVNFRTEPFTRKSVESFRTAYPSTPMILIDNGSADASTELIRELAQRDSAIRSMLLPMNIFHGPAMDVGIRQAKTRFVFLLDSDTEVKRGGFLESMLDCFAEDPSVYAVGKRGWTNRFGYTPISIREPHVAYVHPFASLMDRAKYLELAPFLHHGAPCYRNMWAAQKAGYKSLHFPIERYVRHFGKVTAAQFGYGYNRNLRAQLLLNKIDHGVRRLVAKLQGTPLQPPEIPPWEADVSN